MTINDSKGLAIGAIIAADPKFIRHLKRILPNGGIKKDGTPMRLRVEKIKLFSGHPKKILIESITKSGDIIPINQDEVEFFTIIRKNGIKIQEYI